MKIIATIIIAISLVNMATADRSTRYRSYSTDPTEFRLLDALDYTCTDILPNMDHLNFLSSFFGNIKTVLQPVCNYILETADTPDGFNPTEFCNFLGYYHQISKLMASTGYNFSSPEIPLENNFYRVIVNVTRNLYGIDIDDPTTICPQAHRLFQPSLMKLRDDFTVEYFSEMISALIPELESICLDWKGYFGSLGVTGSLPYQRLVGTLLDIGSANLGYESLKDLCQKMRSEKVFGKDWPQRKLFSNMFVILMRNILLRDEPSGHGGTSQPFGGPRPMFTTNITKVLFV